VSSSRNCSIPLNLPIEDTTVVSFLSLKQYHEICHWHLAKHQSFEIHPNETVQLEMVIYCSAKDHRQQVAGIIMVPDINVSVSPWAWCSDTGDVMTDGWTRYFVYVLQVVDLIPFTQSHKSCKVVCCGFQFMEYCHNNSHWLNQANHIFGQLGIKSEHEEYCDS
jgi:hypothetical protein